MSHDGTDGGSAATGSASPTQTGGPASLSGRSPSGHGAGRRVLVVEDEPNISEAIRFILRRDGWSVAICDSGTAALDSVYRTDPHLVILDVMLPGLSGYDILRALRDQPATAALPVILLTARGGQASRDMANEAGASLFMAKPFANAELLAAVRQLVGV